MIESWTIQRFKSIYDETTLEIRPLTVFTGTNNSGKSTVLQSILLTAQTVQSLVQQRSVTLNGHIVKLGAFDDVVSSGHENEDILIGFQLRVEDVEFVQRPRVSRRVLLGRRLRLASTIQSTNCYFRFSAQGSVDRREILQLQPSLESSTIGVIARDAAVGGDIAIQRSRIPLEERLKQLQLTEVTAQNVSALEFEVFDRVVSRQPTANPYWAQQKIIGAAMLHFLPQTLLVRYDEVEERVKELVGVFTAPHDLDLSELDEGHLEYFNTAFREIVFQTCLEVLEQPSIPASPMKSRYIQQLEPMREGFTLKEYENFSERLQSSYRTAITQRLNEKSAALEEAARAGKPPVYRTRFTVLPETIDIAVDYISSFFSGSVKYLAPLRDEPKPVYPLSGASDPKDIGWRGEHTAAVLDIHRNTPVEYVPIEAFSTGLENATPKTETLMAAVLEWLRYMGVVQQVRTFDKGKLGHELKVATNDETALRDLTHVGVGVSQVLPIVVLALLADRGSTLIFEQPELHLHPRVQTRLADFCLSMTLLRKQCIVETHSEHFVNRLRQRVASSPTNLISKDLKIYFVEADNGRSVYRPLDVNDYGVIKKWPKGFFDEGEELAAAILKASLDKKRQARD